MAGTPRPSGKPPRPSPSEALARARAAAGPRLEAATAAAGPKLEKAAQAAGPKLEKAAQAAGGFLSTLRDRAKETAKSFSEGYGPVEDPHSEGSPGQTADQGDRPAGRPRPRPHTG